MSDLTYEQAITRLEEIVKQLENDEVSLEDTMKLFEEGIELSKICEDKLNKAEQQFTVLLKEKEE